MTKLILVTPLQMVHQLNEVNGQQLVGEVIGAVLLSSDPATVLAASHCFRPLLCALLNLTSVRPLRSAIGEQYSIRLVMTSIAWLY